MKSILDKTFRYTPAKAHEGNADYLRAKFRRMQNEIRAEQKAAEQRQNEADAEAQAKVSKLQRSSK
jgi:hypothetical protein